MSTGNYSLPADSSLVFSQKNGNNVILGGYDDSDFKYAKGLYYHPVRYCEIMFTAAEAALETGRTMEAYEYINQTRLFRGYPPRTDLHRMSYAVYFGILGIMRCYSSPQHTLT